MSTVRNHPDHPRPLREVYAEYLSDAVLAEELGRVTHLPIAFRHPGMRSPDVHRSMRLFAEAVLPVLR